MRPGSIISHWSTKQTLYSVGRQASIQAGRQTGRQYIPTDSNRASGHRYDGGGEDDISTSLLSLAPSLSPAAVAELEHAGAPVVPVVPVVPVAFFRRSSPGEINPSSGGVSAAGDVTVWSGPPALPSARSSLRFHSVKVHWAHCCREARFFGEEGAWVTGA